MTIDKDGLASLLVRVREAKGPDRNLDAMIHHWALDGVGTGAYSNSPAYTSSIDDSLALVERLLPGWEYVLEGGKRHRCVLLHPGNEEGEGVFVETAPTLPLAILAALLTALKEVR